MTSHGQDIILVLEAAAIEFDFQKNIGKYCLSKNDLELHLRNYVLIIIINGRKYRRLVFLRDTLPLSLFGMSSHILEINW